MAALDYSLDQLKLATVYRDTYGKNALYFKDKGKRYSNSVIVVTFKYSVNEFNQRGPGRYVKLGYDPRKLTFTDGAALSGTELLGIETDQPVENPLPGDMLSPYFEYADGKYRLKKQPRKVRSTAKLREELYEEGFNCQGVHYKRWKRSAGSARVGKVLFIDEKLYDAMHEYEMCGLKVEPDQMIDLAALESYIALTTSSIIDTLELDPRNILVVDDYESVFRDTVVSVEEKDGRLTADLKECEIRNSIWDGQGLIDRSAMGKYHDKGMILLRNQFFKCCCFNTNLQQWFADHGVTEVSQLNGTTNATRIEDIKLVTTPSAIKYLKFGTLQEWRDHAPSTFGVVKFDKKTHFFDGDMVQTHYQLLNTLQMTEAETEAFLKPTLDYFSMLKHDPVVLRHHIKYPIEELDEDDISPAQSKNDIVYRMLGVNEDFANTKLYHEFVRDIMKSRVKSLRLGHVLVNGNYSTLLGNPVEMLMQAIGTFDGTPVLPGNTVHSTRFPYHTKLCGSRSPHITMSNVWTPMNEASDLIDRYINLTPEIVCVNSIGENVLQRLSGCDFDSDTVLLTDNADIVKAAEKNTGTFPVACGNVIATKIKRPYNNQAKAALDIKTSSNLIGDIINCSQELNTMIWHRLNAGATLADVMDIYLDVCKLNAAQTIEIDSAKKEFNVSNSKELFIIKDKYRRIVQNNKQIKPAFFAAKDKGKGYYDPEHKSYVRHDTTMDYLQAVINRWAYRDSRSSQSSKHFVPFSKVVKSGMRQDRVSTAKVTAVLTRIQELHRTEADICQTDLATLEKRTLLNRYRQECIDEIGQMKMGAATMIALLQEIEKPENAAIGRKIFHILFGYPNASFFSLIRENARPIPHLVENEGGEIEIYGRRFSVVFGD